MEYIWNIYLLDCIPQENGYDTVVKTIHWGYTCIGSGETAYVYGTVGLPEPIAEFTPFSALTEDKVIVWLGEYMDVNQLQNNLQQQIYDKINPPILNLQPPWIPSPTPTPTQSETPTPTPTETLTPTPTETLTPTPTETLTPTPTESETPTPTPTPTPTESETPTPTETLTPTPTVTPSEEVV
jgi:hypothetical protein